MSSFPQRLQWKLSSSEIPIKDARRTKDHNSPKPLPKPPITPTPSHANYNSSVDIYHTLEQHSEIIRDRNHVASCCGLYRHSVLEKDMIGLQKRYQTKL
jgi:hypothetical protein